MHNTISMPSPLALLETLRICGRARASMAKPSASSNSQNGKLTQAARPPRRVNKPALLTGRLACRLRRMRHCSQAITGSINRAGRAQG